MLQSFSHALSETPVLKGALVGTVSTLGAVVEQDWKILAVGAVVQLGMAAITAFAARSGRSRSRRTPRQKTKPTKSPDNGAN